MVTALASAVTPVLAEYIYLGGGVGLLLVIVVVVLLLRR
jgi:hypothetical protein